MSDREVTQQAEPPPEWPLIKNILAVFGLDAIAFVADWKAAQQQAEPVMVNGLTEAETSASRSVVGLTKQAKPMAWDKPSDNFNEWWDSNYEDPANPFEKDSAAWWAWAGWKAAQTVQEPVAWLYPEGLEALQNGKCWTTYPTEHEDCNIPLYIALPQRQWVGLTDVDVKNLELTSATSSDVRNISAELKEKNT